MHDLAFFRANFDRVVERLATRGALPGLDGFRELDKRRRSLISQTETLKAKRKSESAEIGKLRQAGQDTSARQAEMRQIGE